METGGFARKHEMCRRRLVAAPWLVCDACSAWRIAGRASLAHGEPGETGRTRTLESRGHACSSRMCKPE
eukprot:2591562-Prymnesium_polylepis.1